MIKISALLIVSFSCFTGGLSAKGDVIRLTSPNGQLCLEFCLADDGSPAYQVNRDGKPLIAESKLGLKLKGDAGLAAFDMLKQETTRYDTRWKTVAGERTEIRDHYRQLTVSLKEKAAPNREMQIAFRAYDEGVAFRYLLPKQAATDKVIIAGEVTEFRFPADHFCHAVYSAQGNYARVPLSKVGNGAERPLTIETGSNGVVALAEAGLLDFSRMKFGPLADKGAGVAARLDGRVNATLPICSPWRVIMAAPNEAKLLENNSLILNLNEPCAIADTSWIKPGTVLRELSLTTEGAMQTIDYCAAHHIRYMIFDAGWYGQEFAPKSDATRVNLDPARSKGPFDLPAILRYAESKEVGVILYVNDVALRQQLETILPLYRKWGVKGVKYGFVKVGDQESTAFMSKAIRLAAENQLMVDIHDEWRPTGTQRTWPNLMTAEGIRGDEESHRSNAQSLTHLFTRFLAGPADNTICYFDPRVTQLTNHAYQLAKSVCFYSPWQFIYWYDRPLPAGQVAAPNDRCIGDEPELGFFDRLPTAWDETRVIDGEVGKFAVIARRREKNWWVGCMNAEQARSVKLKLDFLAKDRAYEAVIYSHDPAVATRTHVKIERRPVKSGDELQIELGKNSGQALEIQPVGNRKKR